MWGKQDQVRVAAGRGGGGVLGAAVVHRPLHKRRWLAAETAHAASPVPKPLPDALARLFCDGTDL